MEAMEVWPQFFGCGWEGEYEPSQLRYHGQLLRGQACLHGGPGFQATSKRSFNSHMAGCWTRYV